MILPWRLISNQLIALNLAVCLCITLLLNIFPIWQGLLISLIIFVIDLLLFKYKVCSAGDIKLLMEYSLCFSF